MAVECLFEHGANVSAVDLEGDNPLHCAAYAGHPATAQVIVCV